MMVQYICYGCDDRLKKLEQKVDAIQKDEEAMLNEDKVARKWYRIGYREALDDVRAGRVRIS